MPDLPPQDKKVVKQALSALPARINQAKDKELGDMMGKLKEVCLRSNGPAIYLSPLAWERDTEAFRSIH